jgi:hypothetical protein
MRVRKQAELRREHAVFFLRATATAPDSSVRKWCHGRLRSATSGRPLRALMQGERG